MKYVLCYGAREVKRFSNLEDAKDGILCNGDNIYLAEDLDSFKSPILPIFFGKEKFNG